MAESAQRSSWWQRSTTGLKQLGSRARTYVGIIAADPNLLIPPLFLLAVMLGLGIWAVLLVAKDQEHDLRLRADGLASNTATALQALFQNFYQPVLVLSSLLSINKSWPRFQPSFTPVAKVLFETVPRGYITSIGVRPNGNNLTGIYPPDYPYVAADILNEPQYRQATLNLLRNGQRLSVDWAVNDDKRIAATTIMRVRLPVFVNASANDTFDMPVLAGPGCPPSICYINSTRVKFWGIVAAGIDVTALSNLSNSYLNELVVSNYRLRLTKKAPATGGSLGGNGSNGTVSSLVVARTAIEPGPAAIRRVINIVGGEWVLDIEPDAGWTVVWKGGAIAVVAVFSVLLSMLLLLLLVSRREHQMLLSAFVPKSVVERVKGDEQFMCGLKSSADTALVEIGTPAEMILAMVTSLLDGGQATTQELVKIRQALLEGANMYQPVDLDARMEAMLDSDVRFALMKTLGRAAPEGGSAARLHHLPLNTDDCFLVHVGSEGGTQRINGLCRDVPSSPSLGVDFGTVQGGLQAILSSCASDAASTALSPWHSSANPVPTGSRLDCQLLASTASMSACYSTAAIAATTQSVANVGSFIGDVNRRLPSGVGTVGPGNKQGAPSEVMAKSPSAPLVDEVESLLASSMNSWHFDVFALDKATQGHALSTLGFFLIQKAGLMQHFKAPPKALVRYLCAIEAGYKPNPYHNSMHASSVLHAMHMFLCHGGLSPGYVDPLSHLACYLAAIIHDYEHQGLTNDYLINACDPLATRYNDRSPMENHHLAAAFELLQLPSNNFLSPLSRSNTAALRKLVIELVLATDMKNHFATVSQFSTVHMLTGPGQAHDDAQQRTSASGVARTARKREGGRAQSDNLGSLMHEPIDEAERLLSLQMALKCADLSHLCDDLSTHMRWVACLEDEFFQQGDQEKEAGLSVSPLFDRDKPGVTKSQVGFFDFVAVPMFQAFSRVFQEAMPAYNGLLENLTYWRSLEEP